jgi:transposase
MKVFIGVDPHRLSVTIEVVDDRETVLTTGRFGTDMAGYAAMLRQVAAWPERVWAVEGSNGAGRPLAQQLLADGEHVVDVPAKLAARVRLFDTGHNRKTDAHDAHAGCGGRGPDPEPAGPVLRQRAGGAADARRPP